MQVKWGGGGKVLLNPAPSQALERYNSEKFQVREWSRSKKLQVQKVQDPAGLESFSLHCFSYNGFNHQEEVSLYKLGQFKLMDKARARKLCPLLGISFF